MTHATFLLRNGHLISREQEGTCDILVRNGIISDIGQNLACPEGVPSHDVSGLIVLPGLVDMHVHLREPGREDKETIQTGARGAVKGGITHVACMPNTQPVNDNASVTRYILDKAKNALCYVHPIGAITKNQAGESLAEMVDMFRAGAVAFSDDGYSVLDSQILRQAMEYNRITGTLLISHCEDPALSEGGLMHEGRVSLATGLKGIPPAAEDVIIQRDIQLAEYLDVPLHIAHLSTRTGLEIVARAKERGAKISAEVTPHHLALTEDELYSYNTNAKINPPLRTAEDTAALKQGVKNGTIDAIASDHAPHTRAEKEIHLCADVPSGTIGLETLFPVAVTECFQSGLLDMRGLLDRLCYRPARLLNISAPALKPGEEANLFACDPDKEQLITEDFFVSKSRNSVFLGKRLKGWVKLTVAKGRLCYLDGRIIE